MKKVIAALVVSAFAPLSTAHAIPPPDFLFSAGAQIAQTFSIVCVCISALCGVGYRQIEAAVRGSKPIALAVIVLLVVLISFILTFGIEVLWT